MSADSFYLRTSAGHLVCRLCQGLDGGHTADCAVVAMHQQLRELAVSLGLFVVTMHDTLDVLEAKLRGETREEVSHGVD